MFGAWLGFTGGEKWRGARGGIQMESANRASAREVRVAFEQSQVSRGRARKVRSSELGGQSWQCEVSAYSGKPRYWQLGMESVQ